MTKVVSPLLLALPVGAVLLVALSGCQRADDAAAAAAKKPRPQQVRAVKTETTDVPLRLSAQGHVMSLNQVDLRPQVSAVLRAIHFKEGDDVKAGQLLFSLDDRDAAASQQKMDANIVQYQAQLVQAERDLLRSRDLATKGFVSPSAIDTAQARVDTLKAQIAAARADSTNARVALTDRRIVAPFSGRTGALNAYPGSLVQPGNTQPLVTLTQLDPISIRFTLPEAELNAVRAAQAEGPVTVTTDLGKGGKLEGKLTFIDNTIDTTSGTIVMKAEFANPKHLLWPGMYTPISIEAGVTHDAVVLPAQALQSGPAGRFVYRIQPDQTVASQPVQLVRVFDERAIVTGVQPGVKVVSEGGQNLRPGVQVQEASGPASKGGNGRASSASQSKSE
ncbi:RND family efflux transporter, MFP subunit [Andreprevotia lacus DSM 23236]|jgi:RND family efflux transporter MFP subunit|uniref:RND family efflux transporter, MFP subunit n=1 Tax=Andreprevotia lacus DSM 23236 TaxID=1121001 RepID=A0A1W1X6A8_9NEIS|nr:efflux RND transporter periplasmic adaptor subunit [Andreprevotia lacus]SMC19476.1 RND family efflux transporter, MFP subunit [Andreprevotia lacus DSM 23236]